MALLVAAACGGVDQTGRDLCDEGLCAPGTLTWAARAQVDFGASTVEAVANTTDEPPWFAGTFDYDVTLDTVTMPWDAVGTGDPFVARLGALRLGNWAIDAPAAYPVRVFGIQPDPEDGVMLFVTGQQSDTRQRLEVVWFDRDRMTIARETLALLDAPGALGGAAVVRDARGWPVVAISGTRINLDGAIHDGVRAMVIRLGQGFERQVLVELSGVELSDLDVEGELLVISGRYLGQPGNAIGEPFAGWPACADPDPCGFVAGFDAGIGELRWVQPIHAPGGAQVDRVAAGGGFVVAMASAAGAPTEPALGTGPLPAYLMTLEITGDAQPFLFDQTVLAEAGTEIGSRDLDVASDGDAIIALSYNGTALVGTQPLVGGAEPGNFESVVAELGTDLLWHWVATFERSQALETVMVGAVAVDGDQVAVGGSYRGNIVLANGLGVPTPAVSSEFVNGFALELHR